MAISANEIQSTHMVSVINELLPGAKVIKLRGYSRNNKDYKKAKMPPYGYKWKDEPCLTDSEILHWLTQGGWIGAVIPRGMIIIDVDSTLQGKFVKELLEGENIHHHAIKTPNGWQFIFKAESQETNEIKQVAKFYSQLGVIVDTKPSESGYIVFPTGNTVGRHIVSKSIDKLDELPHYLRPVRNTKQVKDKTTGDTYNFPIPIEGVGSRNTTLYNFASHLRSWGVPNEELRKSMGLIYEYFLLDKSEFPPNELNSVINSAIQWKIEPSTHARSTVNDDFGGSNVLIPPPYQVIDNKLIKVEFKEVKGEIEERKTTVSRMAPMVLKELSNIERNSVHYEVSWKDRGREKREVVPASVLATKKDLLTLADKGLPVTDLNYKNLIDYFEKFREINLLEQSQMVERLGHIKDMFIHPLYSNDIEIVPNDIGEKQLLEAFETKGTAESWNTEVFERIKQHPKVLFMVLASFASVILRDLKVSPFIVDLSGSTSQGKTTALQVARSVWGTEELTNEWNATRVSIERKAGFLNSFPIYMDDTRKADERTLQSIVYQFSGGRSKGRGSLKGSQREATWNNILLSTGEVSLTDYAGKAGGAAARVIPLIDQPFENVDYQYFSLVYKAIDENYGAIGLEFLKKWQEQKEKLIPDFYRVKEHYMNKSKENEVLTRISMYYAAVHFAGFTLKNLFNLDLHLGVLDRLFDEIAGENKALDKPKELLEQILLKLDSTRRDIYYNTSFTPLEIKALYKYDTICLTPSFLKDFLGPEEKMIRREWLKRGLTLPCERDGSTVDYKQVKHDNKKFKVVIVNPSFIENIGLDFSNNDL